MNTEDLPAITDQELRFCEAFVQDGNAIRAVMATRTIADIKMRDKLPALDWLLDYFKDLPRGDDGNGVTHAET